jgi:hypothetical protein
MIESARTISVDIKSLHQQDTHDGVSCFFETTLFPSSSGVVEMIADDGSSVLLAAAGNIRSFITQRLIDSEIPNSKANLAPITARVIAYPTGSAFESDMIVLERAREVDLVLYAKLTDQNRRSVIVLDRRSKTWRAEDTLSLNPDEQEVVVGPIQSDKAAKALGEALDDVYELCRYPKELALAPNGTPCAYKQMGRCPGACDGSETVGAYNERFTLAVQVAQSGVDSWKQSIAGEIQSESAAMNFEQAQLAKRLLDQVEKLPADAIGLAASMDEMCCVCITPGSRKGWAMVWIFNAQGLIPIVGLNTDFHSGFKNAEGDLCDLISRCQSPMGYSRIQLDRFSLIVRHWMTKPSRARRRRVTILDLRQEEWGKKIASAIVSACAPADPSHEDEEHTHITG